MAAVAKNAQAKKAVAKKATKKHVVAMKAMPKKAAGPKKPKKLPDHYEVDQPVETVKSTKNDGPWILL